jgi:thioredoxin-related protein
MRSFAVSVATLLVCLVSAAPAPAAELRWRSFPEGLAEAQATGKPMLVDVYTDWCGWCKRMDRDVYSKAEVRNALGSWFVPVKLNAEAASTAKFQGRSFTSRTLAQHFGVNGYPTTVFLRSTGATITTVPGYVQADRFALILRYIGEEHLDRGVPWADFERKARGGAR